MIPTYGLWYGDDVMTTNFDLCGYVSTVRTRYAEMSLKGQRRNKLIEFLVITKLSVTVSLPVILVTMVFHCIGLHAGGLNHQITKREFLTNKSIRSARGWWAARPQGWTAHNNWWHVIFCSKFCVTPYKCHVTTVSVRQEEDQCGPACLDPQIRRCFMRWAALGLDE